MNRFCRPDRHRTPQFTRATQLGSKHDLERDSGFSDASSEYLSAVDLTDSEDAGRNGSIVSHDTTGPQVALMGGSYAGLSPMIIMNNFVLKQPSQMVQAEKQWGFSSPLEVMPQSQQVVLLQPMLSNGSGSSTRTGSESTRQSKGYKPVLKPKSYPRIAPHPADPPTKRAGLERLRVSSTSGYDQRQKRRHHSRRLYSAPSLQTAPQPTVKAISTFEAVDNQSHAESQEQLSDKSLSISLSHTTDEFSAEIDFGGMNDEDDMYQDAFSTDGEKQKRFSNTYNILHSSGLLGITMRTKQLIKDNKRTQGQLQQLREHTALLLEALGSGDPTLWTKLQLSLQRTDKEQRAAKAHSVLE